MDGIWLEDGTFQAAPGQKGKFKSEKGKGKGDKGKGGKCKGKSKGVPDAEEPPAKKAKTEGGAPDDEEEGDHFDFEGEWKDKLVCLVNLKAAALNGVMGHVREYLGAEEVLENGKKRTIRRFLVALEAGKGEKSIKLENLYKVMTGSLVKLRGLDQVELNDSVAECGRLDVASMRYDVTLSDGRHVKVKPANADFYARFESSKVAGDAAQLERLRSANGLRDRLAVIEEFQYPAPLLLPASALADYATKFPKSVVIGRSNAANPKGVQALAREVVSSTRVPPGSRLIFVSLAREHCVGPNLTDMRHDELLRLGKFGSWALKKQQSVFFLIPGAAAKGPPSALAAATCAWPLYLSLAHEVLLLPSERWQKSSWARLDALLAVWARRPIYLLPENYKAPLELADGKAATEATEAGEPWTKREEEPLTLQRPSEGSGGTAAQLLASLAERAAEAEAGAAKVQCPTIAVRRLG